MASRQHTLLGHIVCLRYKLIVVVLSEIYNQRVFVPTLSQDYRPSMNSSLTVTSVPSGVESPPMA